MLEQFRGSPGDPATAQAPSRAEALAGCSRRRALVVG